MTAALLVALSALLYFVHYCIFHDAHHIFIFLVADIAFVPVEVCLVVFVIERMLTQHEKGLMLNKLNMVIGTFFSELGTQLLGELATSFVNRDALRQGMSVKGDWSPADFKTALDLARGFDYQINVDSIDLAALRETLAARRGLLLTLLANPNLLEHDRFTDLLWAVFHLLEELVARDSLSDLPKSDKAHLAGDIKRVCSHLTVEWLFYCQHLRSAYPFIFSIVVRTHPLQDNPVVTVMS